MTDHVLDGQRKHFGWLRGWEGIAAYLGVSVEDVKLWHQLYGLPAERLHPSLPTKVASPINIERWVCRAHRTLREEIPNLPPRQKVSREEVSNARRYESDLPFTVKERLSRALRSRLNKALRSKTKCGSAVGDLGCSVSELKIHLENQFLKGMTWANYGFGRGRWCIDHIFPLAKTRLIDQAAFRRACHYSNLRPLWFIDNIRKGANIIVA